MMEKKREDLDFLKFFMSEECNEKIGKKVSKLKNVHTLINFEKQTFNNYTNYINYTQNLPKKFKQN